MSDSACSSHGVLQYASNDRCAANSYQLMAPRFGVCALPECAALTLDYDDCRYEGQFERNKMDGYGVYVWADGTYVHSTLVIMNHGNETPISSFP